VCIVSPLIPGKEVSTILNALVTHRLYVISVPVTVTVLAEKAYGDLASQAALYWRSSG